jgi:hypothetical protein
MADKRGTFSIAGTADDNPTIALEGDTATLTVGSGPKRPAKGQGGRINVVRSTGQLLLRVGTSLPVMGVAPEGQLMLFDELGKSTVSIRPEKGDLQLGGNGHDGDIRVLNAAGASTIRLDGADGVIRLGDGAAGVDGDLVLSSAKPENTALPKGTIHLNGSEGSARFGGQGTDGRLALFGAAANTADERNAGVFIDGALGDCWIGGNGVNGDIMLFAASTVGNDVRQSASASIRLDGEQGDILLRNADCAEDFDVIGAATPGDVMVLSSNGHLRCCDTAYDRKVVGVISGAGGFKPGIVLDRRPALEGERRPVALMGKAYCKADATQAAIEVGDLLTTSPTPGHAMAASNCDRAFGAILGKALQPLKDGRDLIPILICLQ